jgi:hypothetical protein
VPTTDHRQDTTLRANEPYADAPTRLLRQGHPAGRGTTFSSAASVEASFAVRFTAAVEGFRLAQAGPLS